MDHFVNFDNPADVAQHDKMVSLVERNGIV